MIIRKLYKFENAHVVRDCSTKRCRASIHGHSYEVELLFTSNFLDHGQMVYDFGLTKLRIKELIDSFDHGVTIWRDDEPAYILQMKTLSERWVELPVSPSAEQLARVLFCMVDAFFKTIRMQNGEKEVSLHSVIVHETKTGYAQAFREDAYSKQMGEIVLENIIFSPEVQAQWSSASLWQDILDEKPFINPTTV